MYKSYRIVCVAIMIAAYSNLSTYSSALMAQDDGHQDTGLLHSHLITLKAHEILASPDSYAVQSIQGVLHQVKGKVSSLEVEMQTNQMYRDAVQSKFNDLKTSADKFNRELSAIGSTTDIATLLSSLSGQRMQMEIELAGLKSRREALLKHQHTNEALAKQLEADDPILQQLMEIWHHSEKQLAHVMKLIENKYAPESELASVRAKLAEARIRVEQRKEELRAKASGSGDAKQQLMELGLSISEIQAKLHVVNAKFDELNVMVNVQGQRDTLHDVLIPQLHHQLLQAELNETKLHSAMVTVKSIESRLMKLLNSKNDDK